MVTFPSFARSTRGLFSDIHRENLVEFLEVKLTKVWMPPPVLGCLELLTLRLVRTELPTHQLQFRHWFLCKGFYSGVSTLIYDCISLSVQLGRQYSALWPHFSDRSNKICWLFSLLSFFRLVWMEWRPEAPFSLEARPQCGSPLNYFLETSKTFILGKNQISVAFRHILTNQLRTLKIRETRRQEIKAQRKGSTR